MYQSNDTLGKDTTQKKVTSTYTPKYTKESSKYTKNRECTQYLLCNRFYHIIPITPKGCQTNGNLAKSTTQKIVIVVSDQ